MRKTDPWNVVSQRAAERKLDRIQFGRAPVRMKLMGAPVDVLPLPGNMFRITLDMAAPNAGAAARRLNDAGTDLRYGPGRKTVAAEATWDTSVHFLVMTGDLR